jgi:hypothetical protein
MRGHLSFPIFHLPFSIEDRGRHSAILKMENGKWEMANDKWHTDVDHDGARDRK